MTIAKISLHCILNLNWAEENKSSSLVSEIRNMSILVSMMEDNASNLFLIELIFKWLTIISISQQVQFLHQEYRCAQYYRMGLE